MTAKMYTIDSDILESIWGMMSDCRMHLSVDSYLLAKKDFKKAMKELEVYMVSMGYSQKDFDKKWKKYPL